MLDAISSTPLWSMANIFINITISLKHRSQITEDVLLWYYLALPKSHLIYSVLVLLILNPFDSRVWRHNSSFLFTPRLSSTRTTSSTKNIHQGISPCISLVTSPITKANSKGSKLNLDVVLVYHQDKKVRAQNWYSSLEVICVPITCSNTSHRLTVGAKTLCLSKVQRTLLKLYVCPKPTVKAKTEPSLDYSLYSSVTKISDAG
jgi:hypothetical protein